MTTTPEPKGKALNGRKTSTMTMAAKVRSTAGIPDHVTVVNEPPILLTVVEAAKLLRVQPGWIRKRTRFNLMPAAKRVGRHIRIDRAQLLAWVDAQGPSA
jgi:excisionase family DNA binding protein